MNTAWEKAYRMIRFFFFLFEGCCVSAFFFLYAIIWILLTSELVYKYRQFNQKKLHLNINQSSYMVGNLIVIKRLRSASIWPNVELSTIRDSSYRDTAVKRRLHLVFLFNYSKSVFKTFKICIEFDIKLNLFMLC